MDDPALPGAADLLGSQAREMLAPAVTAGNGQVLSARPTQVRYDPGRRIAVRYAAKVQWPSGRRTETLGALIDAGGLPERLTVVEDDTGVRAGVWRYPHDPFLPGLPHAAYPQGVEQLLRQMGLPADAAEITPLVYRPSRRAVLRVRTSRHLLYLKVVHPTQTAALRAVHDAFVGQTPAPRCLAWSDELGLLVLEALPGTPLTRPLVDGGELPGPAAVADVLRGIRDVALPDQWRPTVAGVAWYGQVLRTALPEAAEQIEHLVGVSRDRATAADVTTHGDLYASQLLVDGPTITGVLDVDGAGQGTLADDPANLLAHLLALAHVRPGMADRIHAFRRRVEPVLAVDVDPEVLRATVTGVLLGLATSPFRSQATDWRDRTWGWLTLARQWAERAGTKTVSRAAR